jgi:2-polyprenyl-3-methyl-5-hydroxy-6-metoxy-1,4-benzoquinol methylase
MGAAMSGGQLDGKLSPFLRRTRMKAARPYLCGRVLDWGCGNGDLCRFIPAETYLGVDVDEAVLAEARQNYPAATFLAAKDFAQSELFNTIAALAVIEHLPDPASFLRRISHSLAHNGRIVLTTPNPLLDWAHGFGAKFGVFAFESHEEHQSLMNRRGLERTAREAELRVIHFERFLYGANQLAVLERA